MYYTYMLRCADNSIYTGITTDLRRRFEEHSGKCDGGAKYTKSRKPIRIEAAWASDNRIDASKLEYRIKHLTKKKKEQLAASPELLEEILGDKIDSQNYVAIESNLL